MKLENRSITKVNTDQLAEDKVSGESGKYRKSTRMAL